MVLLMVNNVNASIEMAAFLIDSVDQNNQELFNTASELDLFFFF